jgi:serine/threonine protein kinase
MVEKMSNIPLHVRGRAEKWELPRSEIQITNKIGEGQGGMVFKCRWRALDCAAKLLTQDSKTSLAYHDMVNEISTISHLRHPNLVLFLGACTVGNEPLLILSEFMAGGSLEDRFAPGSSRPPQRMVLRWIVDLSRAVCFLHNCTTPIIHRCGSPRSQ